MVREFERLMENRRGTYHLVDQRGRRVIRRKTGSWVYGTLVDLDNSLVLFEDPDPAQLKATTLHVLLPAAQWVPDRDNIPTRPCPCKVPRCEGQLTVTIKNDSPGPEWTLDVKEG